VGKPKLCLVELRELSMRLVLEQQSTDQSSWATICSIAEMIGLAPETLLRA
jgi:hypothetical protein